MVLLPTGFKMLVLMEKSGSHASITLILVPFILESEQIESGPYGTSSVIL